MVVVHNCLVSLWLDRWTITIIGRFSEYPFYLGYPLATQPRAIGWLKNHWLPNGSE